VPANRFLIFYCPREFPGMSYPFTSYLWLVRPNLADGSKKSLPGDAALIVESANCKIPIAAPRDLSWESLWEGDSPFGEGKLNSTHPLAVTALRADGQVIHIHKDMRNEDLRALLEGRYAPPGPPVVMMSVLSVIVLFGILFVVARHYTTRRNRPQDGLGKVSHSEKKHNEPQDREN
jgi:hypothetical protein